MSATLSDHTLAPAEQYLRALWDAKWLYLVIVAAFVLGAVVITALLPKTYSSQAILSVRQSPTIGALGLLYDSVTAPGDGTPIGGRQELVPSRFAKRLLVNRTVTLAAQDAGIDMREYRLADAVMIRFNLFADSANQPASTQFSEHAGVADSNFRSKKRLAFPQRPNRDGDGLKQPPRIRRKGLNATEEHCVKTGPACRSAETCTRSKLLQQVRAALAFPRELLKPDSRAVRIIAQPRCQSAPLFETQRPDHHPVWRYPCHFLNSRQQRIEGRTPALIFRTVAANVEERRGIRKAQDFAKEQHAVGVTPLKIVNIDHYPCTVSEFGHELA